MSRAELLEKICYTDYTNECSACDGRYNCSDCKEAINPLLDEYDKQIRADVIDSIIQAKKNKFFCVEDLCDESKNCNDCEIRYLEQLKEQK